MPAKNEERTLPSCIRSILSQDYNKELIEVIVIDDYSTDNTAVVAKRCGAILITPDLSQGQTTRAHNKNLAVQFCRGDYVIFLDAHIILPSEDWLRRVATYIKSSNLDFASFLSTPSPELTPLLNILSLEKVKKMILPLVGVKGYSAHFFGGSMVISKDVFNKLGGFPEIPVSEDIALYKKAIKYGVNYKFIPELYVYHLDAKLQSLKHWIKRNLKEGFYSYAYGWKYSCPDKWETLFSMLLGLLILGVPFTFILGFPLILLLCFIPSLWTYRAFSAMRKSDSKIPIIHALGLILIGSVQAFLIRMSAFGGIVFHFLLKMTGKIE
ncbi:glycosyltransferase [Candidatus Bathyarchaeota archaeon]|nr:glycosyltransferase [Candidatus Bathyarchaeota archaeon]